MSAGEIYERPETCIWCGQSWCLGTCKDVKRLAGIDNLRGIAILLMVLDHLVMVYAPGSFLGRFTITRAALPLFCLVAGSLSRSSPNWSRLIDVAAAGVVATYFGYPLGIGQPDILLLLAFCLAVLPFLASLPILIICIIAPYSWPYPITGYHPCAVLALLMVGYMFVDRVQLHEVGRKFPSWVGAVGRYPLSIYIVHLGVLWLISGS